MTYAPGASVALKIMTWFAKVGLWALATTMTGGFPPEDIITSSITINMYPLILPSAVVLFFVFSRGWRWFAKRPAIVGNPPA